MRINRLFVQSKGLSRHHLHLVTHSQAGVGKLYSEEKEGFSSAVIVEMGKLEVSILHDWLQESI